ncbi:MAG TPA: hypothetical protein VFS19_00975 [Planctomycetota bacterium]|nr:hypothetical protein [Planctomycetota bacterium]
MIRTTALLALLAVVSCGKPGLRGHIDELRAEIQALEKESVSADAPLWPDQGENAFNPYIEDYTPRIPDFIYNHVTSKLRTMKDPDIDAMAQPKTDFPALIANPTTARGKLYRVSGRIGHLAPERQAGETISKSREVFAGTLFNGEQPVHFHVVHKPDVVYLGSDEVEFVGVFVKVLGYPKPGEPTVSAPFFIAKTLRKYY